MSDNQIVANFYNLAFEFCRYLRENEIVRESVDYLISMVMKLYVLALDLPSIEPETENNSGDMTPIHIRINKDLPDVYWQIFNPFNDEESVCGSLTDDLSDISRDLQIGIHEYNSGRLGNAVFEWRLGLDHHWGKHAVGLIQALHAIRTD